MLLALTELPGHKVRQARPVLRAYREFKERQVIQVLRAYKAFRE